MHMYHVLDYRYESGVKRKVEQDIMGEHLPTLAELRQSIAQQLPGALKPAVSQLGHNQAQEAAQAAQAGSPASLNNYQQVEVSPLKRRVLQALIQFPSKIPSNTQGTAWIGMMAGALAAAGPPLLATMTDEQLLTSIHNVQDMLKEWID